MCQSTNCVCQVESLKAQLEKTQDHLRDMDHNNRELKSRIESLQRDHRNVVEDIDSDSDRYMNQVRPL